jgi:hypothetical protein
MLATIPTVNVVRCVCLKTHKLLNFLLRLCVNMKTKFSFTVYHRIFRERERERKQEFNQLFIRHSIDFPLFQK